MLSADQDILRLASQTRYPLGAFLFVQRGLDFTICREHGELDEDQLESPHVRKSRHVSGPQLCQGLRDLAIQEYGLLARVVLRRWNVRNCEDFGRIVFAMLDGGLMQKTENDSLDDFADVFDFADAFGTDLMLVQSG